MTSDRERLPRREQAPPSPQVLPEDPALNADEAEDAEFFRLYGPWDPLAVDEVTALLEGFPGPWWIVGGVAVEAFTGVSRKHEDIDVSFFRRDLAALRAHFAGGLDLWSVGSGMLRPVTDKWPDMHPESDQVWVREHALAPWRMDMVATPDLDGRWVFRRDPGFTAPLEEVTWTAGDGTRYLNPEIALAYKALLDRRKDRADLDAVVPLLDDGPRDWLRETVAQLYPAHAWLDRL